MKIPEFQTQKQLFAWLVENKDDLLATKMATVKHADAVTFATDVAVHEQVAKAAGMSKDTEDVINRSVVINTTNLMDSHDDVHIPGLWKKSLSENRKVMHLQEHQMAFDHIIASAKDVTPYTKQIAWKDLGANLSGMTEALIFDTTIRRKRNAYMFEQYKEGNVDNHSVGMRYVKLYLAINDKDYKEEIATWNKYIDQVANREQAEAKGYFFAVTEAKVIEGSAVPMGSNWVTPTLNESDGKSEPVEATREQEPVDTTPKADVIETIQKFKIF